MTIKTVKCDICGRDKGEANRWYVGEIAQLDGADWVAIYSHNRYDYAGIVDLCSRECVSKFTNREMDKWESKQ